MAQRIAGTGKRRSVVDSLKEQESTKRLKQGRLSFQPLGCKPLTPLNNTSASRKRKISEHDSPNTKTKLPKVPDLKNSCEKVDPVSLNDDNEVSSTSASETECLNVNCAKSKTGKANLLEKFVRREDEISSTNDVIDLTDSLDENDPKENSPMKAKSPRKSVLQSPRSKSENCLKDKAETNFSRKLIFDKEESVKKETESELGESDSSSKHKENEPENVSMECVKTADVQEGKDVNKEGTKSDEVDDIITPSKNQSLNSSVCEISASPSITPQKEKEESSTSSKTPAGKEDLSPACTPKTPASANSSISSEGTTPLTGSKKKRVLSKKQEEKAAVRQKVKEEKEKQRQDAKEQKEKERLEKKQKRDEEKAEKERLRKEEKEKKEKERIEKKEQVEKEKQMKQQQKDDEKQKKMEKLNAKLEEKKMKEEEKRLKEEQKQKEEEEKERQTQKRKEAFTSFFIKPKAVTSTKVTKAEDNLFIPFELKKDMTLAPVKRQWLSEQDKLYLDSILKCEEKAKLTYVDELKQGIRKPPRTNRVLRKKKEIEQEVELLVHDSETVKKVTHAVKLLQFHTDYRPPYYGTWRKNVKGLSPRNPWKKDGEVFDYEVDSDEEWEEEEPGESLSDSNGEEEEGEEEEEEGEDDGWMVPHGYLSEDEGCQDDEEVTPEVLKARQRAKALAWEAELKAKKQALPPIYLGCFWLDKPCPNEEHLAIFRSFETVCIRSSPIETLVSCPTIADGVGEKSADTPSVKASPNSRCRKRALPEEAMPDLIRLVHGNTFGIKKLVREFRLYWKQKCNDTNVSLDESRMEEESKALNDSAMDTSVKALNDSAMDTSVNMDQSIVKSAESPVPAEATEQEEPMETDCKDKTAEEEVSSKKQEDSILNDESSDSCVSKRQLEIKITAIAVREKREGKKPCWYVSDSVLKQYNMEDLSLENSWVYVSGDMTKKSEKKTPNQLKEKKTPTQSADTPVSKSKEEGKPTPIVLDEDGTTPHKGKNASSDTTPKSRKSKKEGSAKKTPKDQPSIMAFAKKAVGESTGEKMGNAQDKDANQSTSDSTKEIINGDHKTTAGTKPDCAEDPAGSQQCVQQMDEDCIVLD